MAALVVAGAILFAPSLGSPFLLDDYIHQSMVSGTFPGNRGPLDLYNFVDDDNREAMIDRGLIPWWAASRLTIHFFRPLSSALLWADHRLFDEPLVPHLESLAWWLALVFAVRSLYRRRLAPRPALVATAIFALAPCHALPLAWLANREVLLSLTFSVLALIQLDAWRDDQRLFLPVAAAAFFALGMAAGEYGLTGGAYVLTAELRRRDASPRRRTAGVLTFALPAAAYLALRAQAHCGSRGTGFYLDPLRVPLAFLAAAPRRLSLLMAEAWFSFDTETVNADTPVIGVIALVAGIVVLIAVLRRPLRRRSEREQSLAASMLPGSILALTPLLAVAPSPRLAGAALLGMAPCIALFLDEVWFSSPTGAPPASWLDRAAGTAAMVLGFAHLVHGPATGWLIGREFARSAEVFAANAAALHFRLGDTSKSEVVVMRALGGSFFLPFALDPRGAGPPRWTILAQTGHVLAQRRGPRTLELAVPKGQGLFPRGHDNLFRAADNPIAVGDRVKIPGVEITVLDVDEGGPRSARYECDRDLDLPTLTWIHEARSGCEPAPPPALGFGQPYAP